MIAGIALAIISVLLLNVYLNQQRKTIQEQARKALSYIQANQSAVLVAKNDIARGSIIDAQMLETAIIPNQYLQPQAVTSLDRIAGMITIAPISKGEQLSLTKLTQPRQADAGGLAETTPVGKRAITISVDNISSLAGMIKPQDYVDVIAMIPVPAQTPEGKPVIEPAVTPLFQNVLVLAVGQEIGVLSQSESRYKKEEKKETSSLITLALNPQEANLIAFVQEQGKIRLILRSPADSKIEPVQPASWDALFQYIMPQQVTKPELKAEPQETTEYVEIYRGLNKERVPLSK